jgi:hypothetical protein
MRQSQPLAVYIYYHLCASFTIMFILARFLVAYNWYINIFSAGGILSLFALGSYGLISGKFISHPISHTGAYLVVLLLFVAIFHFLCGARFDLFVYFVFAPGIIQCLILAAIEYFGGRNSEKAKRKNSEA